MRKMSFVFACAAILALVSMASAQSNLNLYLNRGCPSGDPSYGGGTGPAVLPGFNVTPGNATMYLAPNTGALQAHYSNGSLYLYGDVGCRGDGVGNEIVSSLGLDVHQNLDSGPGTGLTADTAAGRGFVVFTSATGAASGPWSPPSPNVPLLNQAGNLLVKNSRAVAVPSSTTDALWNGYAPNTGFAIGACGAGGRFNVNGSNGHYRMARLDLTAGTGAGTVLVSSYSLNLQVGALKITRVYDPTATNGGAPENVAFGYNGAGTLPDASTNGSSPGASSPVADATVIIRKVGDIGGNDGNYDFNPVFPDGQVTGDDVNYAYQHYRASTNPTEIALADCGGNDGNYDFNPEYRDCQVTGDDINYMYQFLRGS